MIVTMSCCLPFLFAFEKASSMISREIECFFLADLSLPWFGFNRSLSMGGIVFKISQNWVDNWPLSCGSYWFRTRHSSKLLIASSLSRIAWHFLHLTNLLMISSCYLWVDVSNPSLTNSRVLSFRLTISPDESEAIAEIALILIPPSSCGKFMIWIKGSFSFLCWVDIDCWFSLMTLTIFPRSYLLIQI